LEMGMRCRVKRGEVLGLYVIYIQSTDILWLH
jgi:hypothetical protein